MSFTRFMQGVLKGDIANMQAEQARQAEELKREQEIEDRKMTFSMNLASAFANKIPVEGMTKETAAKLQALPDSNNPLQAITGILSEMPKTNDYSGMGLIMEQIYKNLPDDKKSIFAENLKNSGIDITNEESYYENLGDILSLVPSETGDDGKLSDKAKKLFEANETARKALLDFQTGGGKLIFPRGVNKLPMQTSFEMEDLMSFANTMAAVDFATKPKDETLDVSNYEFTLGGKSITVNMPDDDNKPANIVQNIGRFMDHINLKNYDLEDPKVRNALALAMDSQWQRALDEYNIKFKTSGQDGVLERRFVPDVSNLLSKINSIEELKIFKPLVEAWRDDVEVNGLPIMSLNAENKPEYRGQTKPEYDKGEFSFLGSNLKKTEEQLVAKNFYLSKTEGDTEILRQAQQVARIPGLFVQNTEGVIENRLKRGGTLLLSPQIRSNLFTTLNRLDLDIEEQIQVLSVLQDLDPIKTPRKGAYKLNPKLESYIKQIVFGSIKIDGKDPTLAQALSTIQEKVKTGEDIIKLIDAQIELIVDNKLPVGFAGEVAQLVNDLWGEGGQFEQLFNLFAGGVDTGLLQYRMNGVDDFKDGQKGYDAYLEKAKAHVLNANKKGELFGQRAAQEVFLAYQIAKFNDEGGRLSNQDFDKNLAAISGGKLTSTSRSLSQLEVVKKRFSKSLHKFKNFNFDLSLLNSNNPDFASVGNQLVRKLSATKQYYQMYDEGGMKDAEIVNQYRVKNREGQDILEPTGTTTILNGKETEVYQVFAVDRDGKKGEARFEDIGGVFVAYDDVEKRWSPLSLSDSPSMINSQDGVLQPTEGQEGVVTYSEPDSLGMVIVFIDGKVVDVIPQSQVQQQGQQ
tara:strand:+ start:2519 stop:5086 length:2568 start_codon:yes stop_codon:yes gene_type:complete